ncbi:MAG: hypothetical protein ACLPX8_10825, partial [Bryobacteraceae bacterium]
MKLQLTRRKWIAAAGGAATLAAGCAHRPAPGSAAVSIVRAPAYDQTLYDTVRRVLALQRLEVSGRHVVIKPTLVEYEPES